MSYTIKYAPPKKRPEIPLRIRTFGHAAKSGSLIASDRSHSRGEGVMEHPSEKSDRTGFFSPLFNRPETLPVLLFFLFFLILLAAGPDLRSATYAYEPPWLRFALDAVFIAGLCLLIAGLCFRSFLRGGVLNVLLLGCGVLAFGLSAFVAGWLIPPPYGPNYAVTTRSLGVLLTSILYFLSALFSAFGFSMEIRTRRGLMAVAAYGTMLLLGMILATEAVHRSLPVFFVVGEGPTVARQVVLSISVTLLITSSALMMTIYAERKSGFLLYCINALLLLGLGVTGVAVGAPGSPLSWLGRVAQYLGNVCLAVASLQALREARSRGTTVERALADFFRESEARFRSLIEMAADAIVSVDQNGKIILMNPAARALFGYRGDEAVGARLEDLVVPEHSRGLFGTCLSGESFRKAEMELMAKGGSHFPAELSCSPAGESGGGISRTIIVRDISERLRAEEAIKSAALFPIQNPEPVMRIHRDGSLLFSNPAAEEVLAQWRRDEGNDVVPARVRQRVEEAMDERASRGLELEVAGRVYSFVVAPVAGSCYANLYGRDITASKAAEEALREAKNYAETLIRTANVLIVGLDATGSVVTFNDQAETVTGYTRAEVLGRNWFEVVVPKERYPAVWKEFGRLHEGALSEVFENPILTKDGRERIISWRNSEIREGGTVRGTISFGRDITESRQAEESLRAYHELLKISQRAANAGIWSWEIATGNLTWSEEFYALFGLDPSAPASFVTWLSVLHPEDRQPAMDRIQRSIRKKIPLESEYRIIRPGGSERWIRAMGNTDFNEIGQPQSMSGICIDVTESKRAEEELRASELRMKAVADHLPVGVWFADEAGRIVYGNEAGRRIWGGAHYVEPDEFHVYRAWWADTGKPLEPGDWAVARAVRNGETSLNELLEIECFDGTRKTILNAAVPLKSADGSLLGVVVLNEDVTARKLAEEALRSSRERFRILSETAGELLKSEEPEKIVNVLCENVMRYLRCDVFFNFLVHDELGRLRLNAWTGIPPEEAARIEHVEYGVAVCGCVARDGEAIVAEHIATTPDVRTELVRSYGIRAYACHPLLGPGGKVIGTLSFGTRNRDTFSPEDLSLMRAVTDQVAAAMNRVQAEAVIRRAKEGLEESVRERTVELMLLMEDLEKSRDELRKLASELVRAEERERKRISVVLHDEVAQTLAAAKMRLDLLRNVPGNEEYQHAVEEAEELIGQSIRQTRALMTDITNPVLYDMGLRVAVEALAEDVKARQGIDFTFTFSGKLRNLDQQMEVMIFQVVKELVQNVVKHSRARNASIRLVEDREAVSVTVADDGAGFDAGDIGAVDAEGGFGLFSIRERAKSYGGKIEIDSRRGKGSRVTVVLPKTAGASRHLAKRGE